MSLPPAEPAPEAVFREMRARACEMFRHALAECSIPRAFSRQIRREGDSLRVGNDAYDMKSLARMSVVSIGKAGHTMAEALANIAGTRLDGIIACPNPPAEQLPGFRYFTGGHPLPNEASLQAAHAILKLVAGGSARSLVLFLI